MKEMKERDLAGRFASLSPEKRALLAMLLKGNGSSYNSFPLSFAQERLWFLDQLTPEHALYNCTTALRLSGELNIVALEQTLTEIVRRHEVLRTTFSSVDGQPMQVIGPAPVVTLPIVDLSHLTEQEQEAEAERIIFEEARSRFDLARGPLLRTILIRMGAKSFRAVLNMHHIICDGWSIGVLVQELASLYETFLNGKLPSLPNLVIQYADFAHWQRQRLRGESLEKLVSYWKRQLDGAPADLNLTTARSRPTKSGYEGAHESFTLTESVSESLRAICRRQGITLFTLLLAAFDTLLYRYSGQSDIVVGAPVANRNRPETEALIGFFVNMLVLRCDLSGNPTFLELIRRVQKVVLEGYAHQELPFEKLVEILQPDRDPTQTPLYKIAFAFQNAPRKTVNLPDLTMSAVGVHNQTARVDLILVMSESGKGISGSLEYNTALFETGAIKQLLNHFEQLLMAVAERPELPLLDIPLAIEDHISSVKPDTSFELDQFSF